MAKTCSTYKSYPCGKCTYRTSHPAKLKMHMKRVHVHDELPEKDWVRPTGKISFVWDHFKENCDKTRVKCDHCLFTFKKHTSTTMLAARHLKSMHDITHKKEIVSGSNASQKCEADFPQKLDLKKDFRAAHLKQTL